MARQKAPFLKDTAIADRLERGGVPAPAPATSLLFPCLWFFLLYGSSGTAPPYLALHYREQVGLSAQDIGYLFAISPFVSFVAATFWTAVADKCDRHRTLLVFLSIATSSTYVLMGRATSFMALVFLTLANSFFGGAIGAFVDIYTLDTLGKERVGMYGRLRMVGTLAVGAFTFATGMIVQTVTKGDYAIAFIIYGVLQAAFILTVAFSPWRKPVPFTSVTNMRRASKEIVDATVDLVTVGRRPFRDRMIDVFGKRSMLVFLATTIVHGVARTMMGTYLFLFLKETMRSTPILLGISAPFNIGLEAPGFFFASFFLARVGFRKMIYVSAFAIFVRAGSYTLLSTVAAPNVHSEEDGWRYAPAILAVELTQGIAFSQFWSAGVHFINAVAPDALKTTAQGVFNGVSGGLASGIGNVLGGILLDKQGPKVLFEVVVVLSVVAAVVFSSIGKLPEKVEPERASPADDRNGAKGIRRLLDDGALVLGSSLDSDLTQTSIAGDVDKVSEGDLRAPASLRG